MAKSLQQQKAYLQILRGKKCYKFNERDKTSTMKSLTTFKKCNKLYE